MIGHVLYSRAPLAVLNVQVVVRQYSNDSEAFQTYFNVTDTCKSFPNMLTSGFNFIPGYFAVVNQSILPG